MCPLFLNCFQLKIILCQSGYFGVSYSVFLRILPPLTLPFTHLLLWASLISSILQAGFRALNFELMSLLFDSQGERLADLNDDRLVLDSVLLEIIRLRYHPFQTLFALRISVMKPQAFRVERKILNVVVEGEQGVVFGLGSSCLFVSLL